MERDSRSPTGKRVAIIGSGMAGLNAAWLLCQDPNVHVVIFEKQSAVGLGAAAEQVSVEGASISPLRVDVPTRVFNQYFYIELMRVYREIGIDFHKASHHTSYNFLDNNGAMTNYFFFSNILIGEWSLPYVKGLSISTLRIIRDLFYFRFTHEADLKSGRLRGIRLIDYLREKKYSREFIELYLVPSFSVMCTCSHESIRNYDAEAIVQFLSTLALRGSSLKRATGGTADIIERLTAAPHRNLEIRTSTTTHAVKSTEAGVVVSFGRGYSETFDDVIIATQANQAIDLIHDPEQIEVLKLFPYEPSDVYLHTDKDLMPQPQYWAPANIFLSESQDTSMTTIWMNQLQRPLGEKTPVFQSWNILRAPKKENLLSVAHFERPIVTVNTHKAVTRLEALQGKGHVWFCGAYVLNGIPLLENAVRSGLTAAERVGSARRPWANAPPAPASAWPRPRLSLILVLFLLFWFRKRIMGKA